MVQQPLDRNRTTGLCFNHTAAHAGFLLVKTSMVKFSEYIVSVLPINEPPYHNQRKEINQSTDLLTITNKPMFFHRHWSLQWTIIPRVLSWDLTPNQVVVRIEGEEVNCIDKHIRQYTADKQSYV